MQDYILLILLVVITIFAKPKDVWDIQKVNWNHVAYYGWITAIFTGAGVFPFYFISQPNKFWVGVSNAVAGGMMLAASYSLVYEGVTLYEHAGLYIFPLWKDPLVIGPAIRTISGFFLGILFIVVTKKILDQFEDLNIDQIERANVKKMVLIIFVMTLHSITEGVGIGVSFGGKSGLHLGRFISLSLAVHNIPEGLAVALVMTSRGISRLRSGLWAVFTSLPQPLFAVPAFFLCGALCAAPPRGLGICLWGHVLCCHF